MAQTKAQNTCPSGLRILKDCIANELRGEFYENSGRPIASLVGLYNLIQEGEHGGADYLFNIERGDDMAYLLKDNTLTAWGLYNIVSAIVVDNLSPYFILAEDGNFAPLSLERVRSQILTDIDEIVDYILRYPNQKGIAPFYEEFVVPFLNTRF